VYAREESGRGKREELNLEDISWVMPLSLSLVSEEEEEGLSLAS